MLSSSEYQAFEALGLLQTRLISDNDDKKNVLFDSNWSYSPCAKGRETNSTTGCFFDDVEGQIGSAVNAATVEEVLSSASRGPNDTNNTTTTAEDQRPALGKTQTQKKKTQRRYQEPSVKEYVQGPTAKDVLLGRGTGSNTHTGNRKYREIVAAYQAAYRTASTSQKTKLSQCVVDKVIQLGGRFLKKDTNGEWYIVTNQHARTKAGQALREENTPEKRAERRRKYNKTKCPSKTNRCSAPKKENQVEENSENSDDEDKRPPFVGSPCQNVVAV